ncbi:unnamed protein product [Adineta steineri]|uniref:G-protein coupled receptors family 1 profile domain-containing protein n=1 Tax=Adineta steineri TaxID=433720 RepID=A0A814Y079_9BILA|nr:unnamed protein product [Adineta steineri]CAF1222503.1 unnamed protein product [Adineta steineri]CAF1335347.1 unnamed protein product [Adineta steineri]CAF3716778.1 unnamed protein product [Adineta steineri]CAF3986806.1 unnamed protein product [Adineta steineri]
MTISQYALGIIWLIGNIGSILTCIVFSQSVFRKSACALYFIASSFSQLLAFNFALLYRMLQYGYNVNIINVELWFCKVRFYLFYVFIANSRYNIIIASIDRYFSSSRNALRRQWSSSKIALRVIICNAIFWSLMYIQVIVVYEISNNTCQPQSGVYGIFFSIYITIDSGILPTFLMLIFGLLTAKNVRQSGRRIVPTIQNSNDRSVRISKKDIQLQKMLVNQIILFIVLNIPNPCYLVYHSFTINTIESPARLTIEAFINNMTYVPLYLDYALTFFNCAISSKIFRRQFLNFIQTKILRRPTRIVKKERGITTRNGLAHSIK